MTIYQVFLLGRSVDTMLELPLSDDTIKFSYGNDVNMIITLMQDCENVDTDENNVGQALLLELSKKI